MRLALGEETEMSVGDFESKLSKDTVQLVRVALGSLNEPAYTTWISMTEYATSRGKLLQCFTGFYYIDVVSKSQFTAFFLQTGIHVILKMIR